MKHGVTLELSKQMISLTIDTIRRYKQGRLRQPFCDSAIDIILIINIKANGIAVENLGCSHFNIVAAKPDNIKLIGFSGVVFALFKEVKECSPALIAELILAIMGTKSSAEIRERDSGEHGESSDG
jgi:hypothetical protein